MGDIENTKRGQHSSYKKRSVEPVVRRAPRAVRTALTTPYRAVSPKTTATHSDVIVPAPATRQVSSVSASTQPTSALPLASTKKSTPLQRPAQYSGRSVVAAASPQKKQLFKKPIHRRTMKHIPTLPSPSRKGILGIYDKIKKVFGRHKKVIYAFGCLVLIAAAGWYANDWYQTKQSVKKEAAYIRAVTAATDPDAAEAYIETQPTIGSIDLYSVDATAPRVLTIPKLGVLTSIKKVGLGGTNQIANPQNIFEAGWFESSATPGSPGAVALIANVSGPTKDSVFRYLNKLAIGDAFTIERGDKVLVRYVVVATETIAYGRPVTEKLSKSYDPAKEGANIITGVGAFNRENKDYLNRLIIYAVRENAPQATQVPTTSR